MDLREKGWRVDFWNVAKVKNKNADFWEKLKEWDVMVLRETWIEKKEWERVKERLPKGYIWRVQWAKRECRRGRAMGGMLMGVKRDLVDKEEKIQVEEKGVIVRNVRNRQRRKIIGVYVKKNLGEVL